MAMEVSKGDVLAGFQQLLGGIIIPALQQQEVTTVFKTFHGSLIAGNILHF